jgi:hypothetical protein
MNKTKRTMTNWQRNKASNLTNHYVSLSAASNLYNKTISLCNESNINSGNINIKRIVSEYIIIAPGIAWLLGEDATQHIYDTIDTPSVWIFTTN